MAVGLALGVEPDVLVYDVMDDLASFKGAPAALRFRHQQALRSADLVFAGGRSLFSSITASRPDAHLFPSGVEREHFSVKRSSRAPRARRIAGYVGVVDERIDLPLIADLAAALPDWEMQLVGPVAKIEYEMLPRAANITYSGPQPYEQLPAIMCDFDVALMPFALNEATRSISPTKTLEYLAAGLPVVSTRVPDVVSDFSHVVTFAEDGQSFARACDQALREDAEEWKSRVEPLLQRSHWDAIADRMAALIAREERPKSRARGAHERPSLSRPS